MPGQLPVSSTSHDYETERTALRTTILQTLLHHGNIDSLSEPKISVNLLGGTCIIQGLSSFYLWVQVHRQ